MRRLALLGVACLLLVLAIVALAGCTGALRVAVAPEAVAPSAAFGEVDGGLYALWGTSSSAGYYQPIAGTAGTVVYWPWAQIEPQDDAYQWGKIDAILDANAVAGARVQLMILHHTTDGSNGGLWADWTPSWVGAPTLRITCGGATANVPDYRSTAFKSALLDLVADLGARYNGDPRVGSVIVATGLDGETQIVKSTSCDWLGALNTQASGAEYRWGQLVTALMDAYAKAFPTTLKLLNNAPGSGRMARADAAVARGIGLKHSGMVPDGDFWEGSDDSLWGFMDKWCATVPCWEESAYGFGNADHMWASLWAGLHYHPVGMDLHKEWFPALGADGMAWLAGHLGVSAVTTPSVWVVLRDTEYPVIPGASGHRGNWEFYLRASGGERVLRADLSAGIDRSDWRARQSRRLDGVTELTYSSGFDCAPCNVTVTVAGTGSVLYVGTQAIVVPRDGAWHMLQVQTDHPPTNLQGMGHYVQMIEVARVGLITATPPPPATLAPTMTPRPTIPPTATPTPVRVALVNGGFESGTHLWRDEWGNAIAEVTLPDGWQLWDFRPTEGNGYYHRPECKPEDAARYGFARVLEGWWGWKAFSTYSNHAYALGQRVAVPRGIMLEAGAYAQAWSSSKDDPAFSSQGSYWLNVGIDPLGGDDWQASSIVWAAALPGLKQLDSWARLVVTATAQADAVTVWLRGEAEWRLKHNDSYWDAAWLRAVESQPEPTLAATMTPTSTRGPTMTISPTWDPTRTSGPSPTQTTHPLPTGTLYPTATITPPIAFYTPTPPEPDLAEIADDLEGMAERMLGIAAKLRRMGVGP